MSGHIVLIGGRLSCAWNEGATPAEHFQPGGAAAWCR